MTDNDMYVGIEAEGRLKGVPTVFCQRPCIAATEHVKRLGYTHVFFGVRGYRLSAEDYTRLEGLLFSAIPPSWVVSLHVHLSETQRIPAWAWERCHILLYQEIDIPKILHACDVELKLENFSHAIVYGNPELIALAYVRDKDLT